MSHISTISLKILDLAALREAVKSFGGEWVENQKTYRWYGRYVGDTPLPQGMTEDQLGKCEHAIRIPGVSYEIGVVKLKEGGYTLAYDYYDYQACGHDGGKLTALFGKGLQKLVQSYAVTKACLTAKKQGWTVQKQALPNGTIKLVMSGV